MDHDFHNVNIIPSVALRCNIPNSVAGSFLIGSKDGTGQFFCDAIFDPSEVFDRCAQLIDTLRKKGLNPTVLVLQTDVGLNHSLKRTSVQLVLMSVFNKLDLDHFAILRCAPNGSARNKVERSMSILNLPLAHVALKQGKIPDVPILEQTFSKCCCGRSCDVRHCRIC